MDKFMKIEVTHKTGAEKRDSLANHAPVFHFFVYNPAKEMVIHKKLLVNILLPKSFLGKLASLIP